MLTQVFTDLSQTVLQSAPAMSAATLQHVPVPWAMGLLGGVLIGAAASLHLLFTGRIMGVSGITNGVLTFATDWRSRALFLSAMTGVAALALPLAPPDAACSVLVPATWQSCSFQGQLSAASLPAVVFPAVAGILTGYGTQMGSGCTSGHGVCGLPRLAIRSVVAVATFMATGAVTASLSNSFPASAALIAQGSSSWSPLHFLAFSALASLALLTRSTLLSKRAAQKLPAAKDGAAPPAPQARGEAWGVYPSVLLSGAVMGVGLLFSGMLSRARVRGFLDPVHGWDPSLAFVMGGAVALNLFTFHFILRRHKPVCAVDFQVPHNNQITADLVLGAAIFGIGWGLYGLCPAPGIMNMVTGSADVLIWNAGMALGMLTYHNFKN